eukprot:Sspe_Gene.107346::Locus_85452_Transcript_2_3_Confidence_0.333_Length_1430::g.107346::m.107346
MDIFAVKSCSEEEINEGRLRISQLARNVIVAPLRSSMLRGDFSEFRALLVMRTPRYDPPDKISTGPFDWYFEVIYRAEKLPQELSDEERGVFEEVTLNMNHMFSTKTRSEEDIDVKAFVFSWGTLDERPSLEGGTLKNRRRNHIASEYQLAKEKALLRRGQESNIKNDTGRSFTVDDAFAQNHPMSMASPADVAKLLHGCAPASVVFYVGAGISREAGFRSGVELCHELGEDLTQDVDGMVRLILRRDPTAYERIQACSSSLFVPMVENVTPTPAHKMLAKVALDRRWPILTTNSDLLCHAAGVKPNILSSMTAVDAMWTREAIAQTQALVIVGVGDDHRSVVSRYREMHPDGKVIVFVMGTVHNYLNPDTDLVVPGDVQHTFTQMVQCLLDLP